MNNTCDVGNGYEGNGWSKYQMLVLQQLKDHNAVLQNLNKEITDMKQLNAVSDAEFKMWKTKITDDVSVLLEKFEEEVQGEEGISKRVARIEREFDFNEHHEAKSKATLALYGSIAMFVLNAIIQAVAIYFKIK